MSTIIAGRKPILEALRAGTLLEKIILLQGVRGMVVSEITQAAEERHVPVETIGRAEFRGLTNDTTTQGIIALVAKRTAASVDDLLARASGSGLPGCILVLDGIEDPQNLGALIRTAECAGLTGVILPRHHAAPINATAIKASAGATEHLPAAEVTNIVTTLEELKSNGYWIVGLDMEGDRAYTAVDYTVPVALVVGSEGKGIRRLVREHCDFVASIPLFGKVASLNASVAGALVMFEATRQRRGFPLPDLRGKRTPAS